MAKTVDGTLQQLHARHHSVLRQTLLGAKQVDIAKNLGITQASVAVSLRSPEARDQLAQMTAVANHTAVDIAKQIRELAPRAVEVMQEIMENDTMSAAVRLKAAMDLLDRGGHGAVKKLDVRATNISLSSQDLEEIKRRAYEMNPDVVDV